MLDFKEKRKIKRLLYSKLTIVVLGIMLAFLLSSVWGVYKKASIAYNNKERISKDLKSLQARKEALVSDIEKLKNSRGVESELRDRFGVVKEGEEVVVLVDPTTKKGQNDEQDAMNSRGLWQKFIRIFK